MFVCSSRLSLFAVLGAFGGVLLGSGGCSSSDNNPTESREGQANQAQPVFGGESDSSTPENNWVVSLKTLLKGSPAFCSGSLITPNHILTAAHCVTDFGDNDEIVGVPPENVFFGPDQESPVPGFETKGLEVFIHPLAYAKSKKIAAASHDLAIVQINRRVPENLAIPRRPRLVPIQDDFPGNSFVLKFTGFGISEEVPPAVMLPLGRLLGFGSLGMVFIPSVRT